MIYKKYHAEIKVTVYGTNIDDVLKAIKLRLLGEHSVSPEIAVAIRDSSIKEMV